MGAVALAVSTKTGLARSKLIDIAGLMRYKAKTHEGLRIFFKNLIVLIFLVGFTGNLWCDPVHEVQPADSCHTQSLTGCMDAGDSHNHADNQDHQAEACSFHCHFLHGLFFTQHPEEFLATGGVRLAQHFLYDGLRSKRLATELLRPPSQSLFT